MCCKFKNFSANLQILNPKVKKFLEFQGRRIIGYRLAEHHNIPLEEFDGLSKDEAKEKLKQELQIPFQTQGYTVNYDIEVWFLNDWA